MSKGLLAWWRRRIVERGLAGVALFSVPVGVAALIGFGTSLSGVVGGLSAVTNGPDAVPASSPTARIKLDRAVIALASGRSSTGSVRDGGGSTGEASNPTVTGTGGGAGGGTGGGTGTTGSSGGGSESGSGTQSGSTITAPAVPDVSLPGTDTSAGDTVDTVNNTVNDTVDNVVSGVDNTLNDTLDNTLNGLLGQ